jgi:hypothetical protein
MTDIVMHASLLNQARNPTRGIGVKVATLFGLLLVLSVGTGAWAGEDVMKQLVPTGKLRVGVAYAPAPTPIFVAKDNTGNVHGVPSTSVTRWQRRLRTRRDRRCSNH